MVYKLISLLIGALLAVVLCFLVYPMLSIVLWLRGLYDVAQYAKKVWSKRTSWERKQVHLGEGEEWSKAREDAIKRNRRFWSENSSENEFNVGALLKTTTGMTMEDLRYNMTHLQSTRRKRALEASLDAVLSKFPSEGDNDGDDDVSTHWCECAAKGLFFLVDAYTRKALEL